MFPNSFYLLVGESLLVFYGSAWGGAAKLTREAFFLFFGPAYSTVRWTGMDAPNSFSFLSLYYVLTRTGALKKGVIINKT